MALPSRCPSAYPMIAPSKAVCTAGRSHQGRAFGSAAGSRPPGACALSGWISMAISVTSLPSAGSWLLRIVRGVIAAARAADAQLHQHLAQVGDAGGVVGQGVGR